jgi:hypothetical protein
LSGDALTTASACSGDAASVSNTATACSGGAASVSNDALETPGGVCFPLASKTQATKATTAPTKMNGMADASRPLTQIPTVLIFGQAPQGQVKPEIPIVFMV